MYFNSSFITLIICNFIGCATSAPDGSSPRGYSQFFLFGYRLKNISSFAILVSPYPTKKLFLFISSSRRSMLLIRVAPEAMDGFLGNNHSLRSFLGLIILSTLFDIRDVIDGVIIYDD
jgi:hypothetical protein